MAHHFETAPVGIGTISLEIPSELLYLRTLRLTTASLLSSWDLDVELVEDARVAVTEACTLLWKRHGRSGSVRIAYRFDGSKARVELQLLATGPAAEGGAASQSAGDGDGTLSDGIAESLLEHLTAWHSYEPDQRRVDFEVRR